MSSSPLVSILIPAFNAQEWIADTIKSALNQTWKKKEIIVVDDGSTDQTFNVVSSFNSPIINIIKQANGGACSARNRAFSECQGEYIQWLDADDLLAPDKITKQINTLGNIPDPWVLCSSAWKRFYDGPKTSKFCPTPLWEDRDSIDWLCLWLSNWWIMPSMGWLVSRPLTEKAGPWNEQLILNDDGEYFCRVVSISQFVKFVPEAYCFYRMANPASISRNTSREAWESFYLSVLLETQHVLAREDSERTRMACVRNMNRAMTILDDQAPDLAEYFQQRVVELGGKPAYIFGSKKYDHLQRIIGKKSTQAIREVVRKIRRRISHSVYRIPSKIF